MDKLIINGGKKLKGETNVSGSKNVVLKVLVAACLTDEEVIIENVPLISDVFIMTDIIQELGGKIDTQDHTVFVTAKDIKKNKIELADAAEIRTSAMFMAPLLARNGQAIIPNPGGCRIGARPMNRTIEGFEKMGVKVSYKSRDGYFYMEAPAGLKGIDYTFSKPTHTGTETLVIAATLAKGKTILRNAALEPEVDELIGLLNRMGAKIKRMKGKIIEIVGVKKLNGTRFKINSDRNEVVTLAIAALITKGDIFIRGIKDSDIKEFLEKFEEIGAGVEVKENGIRFFYDGQIKACDVETSPYPGFMTDWQGPWAVLMTQAKGTSTLVEKVYENRFAYAQELQKMGAKIKLFNPKVENPEEYYNFNIDDDDLDNRHAIQIKGPTRLHNGVVTISDLRAGATIALAALAAEGETVMLESHYLDRGYERFEYRLNSLGADIIRQNYD